MLCDRQSDIAAFRVAFTRLKTVTKTERPTQTKVDSWENSKRDIDVKEIRNAETARVPQIVRQKDR